MALRRNPAASISPKTPSGGRKLPYRAGWPILAACLVAAASCASAGTTRYVEFGGSGYLQDTINNVADAGDYLVYQTWLSQQPVSSSHFARGVEITKQNLTIGGYGLSTTITADVITIAAGSWQDRGLFYFSNGQGNGLSLANLAFSNIKVTTQQDVNGGVVSARNHIGTASLGDIVSVSFWGNTLAITGEHYIEGGGLVGAYSYSAAATIGAIGTSVLSLKLI